MEEEPEQAREANTAGRKRGWVWLRRLGLGLAALAGTLVLALIAVLWVPALSRLALTQGLARWDAGVPASLSWGKIEGSFASGLRVGELRLEDSEGAQLLALSELQLELSPLALFGGEARLDTLTLRGLELHVDHRWEDLSTGEPEPPKPEQARAGGPFELPLRVVAALAVEDLRVLDADALLVSLASASLALEGEGREASVALELAALDAAASPAPLERASLRLAYDAPALRVELLELDSPVASVHLPEPAQVDLPTQRAGLALTLDVQLEALDALEALGGPQALRSKIPSGRLPERVHAELRAQARPGDAQRPDAAMASLTLDLGRSGMLALEASATHERESGQLEAHARLDAELEAGLIEARQPALELALVARAARPERGAPFAARVGLRLREGTTRQVLAARIDAPRLDPERLEGALELQLRGLGLALDAAFEHGADSRGKLRLSVPALERPLGLVAALLDEPKLAEVRGALLLTSECAPEGETPLSCPAQLSLAAFEGFGSTLAGAELSGAIAPLGDGVDSEPRFELELAARSLSIGGGAYAFTQLGSHVEGTPSALSLRAKGKGAKDEIELALALQDEPGGAGRELRFDTLRAVTTRTATLSGIELTQPGALKILDDRIELGALRLRAFGARIFAEGTVALTPELPHDVNLSVRGLELARLDAALPGPSMRGRVNLTARVQGPTAQLRGLLTLDGEQLRVAELDLGELALRVERGPGAGREALAPPVAFVSAPGAAAQLPRARAGDLVTELHLAGPLLRRVDLYARIPIELGGEAPGLGSGAASVRLAVEDFALEQLGALMPATPLFWDAAGPNAAPIVETLWIPEGRIDLDLALDGSLARPELALALRGSRLELDRAKLGSLALFASYDPREQAVDLELNLEPGFIDGLEARAHVPVVLDLRHGRARWLEAREHLVSVDLAGFELEALADALGPSVPALAVIAAGLPLEGELAAGLRFEGRPADPRVDLRIHGRALALGNVPVGQLRVDLGYVHEQLLAQVELRSPYATRLDAWAQLPAHVDPFAATPFVLDPNAPLVGSMHAEALALAPLGALVGAQLDGELSASVALEGSLRRPHASAQLGLAALDLGRGEVGDLDAALELVGEDAHIELDLLREGRHQLSLSAVVPLIVDLLGERSEAASGEAGEASEASEKNPIAWNRAGSHRLRIAADGIDEALLGSLTQLPADLQLDASLALRGGGRLEDFALEAALDGALHKGELEGEREGEQAAERVAFHAELHASESRQDLALALRPSGGEGLDASVGLQLPLPDYLAGQHALGETIYALHLRAPHFELSELAGFLPSSLHDPQGVLEAELDGRGQLATPTLDGALRMHDTAITVVPLRQRLREIELELAFSQKHAELRALHVGAGAGSLSGEGRIDVLSELGLDGSFALEIKDFPLVQPGVPPVAFASKVDLEFSTRPDDLDLHIALREPTLTVAGKAEGGPKAIPTSDSVSFVRAGEPTWEEVELTSEDPDSGHMRIALEFIDPLRITGSPIDMAWGGSVAVERTGTQLEVTGQLDTGGGRLDLAGKQFSIQRGTVALPDDGGVDPYIDLVAATQIGDVEILAKISGRVSRPQLHFSSTPSYSEYEIFSLLVTGSPSPGEAARSNLEVQAASILAAVSSPQLQRKIEETLHLDRAKLEFGATIDQPILTVGKRVSRKVYLETSYHHNAPEDENTAEVRVQYDLARRWSLQSHFGDAAVGGIGAFWSRTLGTPHWKMSASERAAARAERRGEAQGEAPDE